MFNLEVDCPTFLMWGIGYDMRSAMWWGSISHGCTAGMRSLFSRQQPRQARRTHKFLVRRRIIRFRS